VKEAAAPPLTRDPVARLAPPEPPLRRRQVRRSGARDEAWLLFLIGLTLPFPEVGIRLNELFVLSLTTLLALVFALRRWQQHGARPAHSAVASMLAVFIATAIWRHPPSSYLLSIGALALAMLPLTSTQLVPREARYWHGGFMAGLWITIAWMGLTIWFQLMGLSGVFDELGERLMGPEHFGSFWGYRRPSAGFSEPSHLAIYLAVAFVVLDLLGKAGRRTGAARLAAATALVCTGSVSGLVIILLYLFGRALVSVRRALTGRLSGQWLVRGMLASYALLGIGWYMSGSSIDVADEYVLRLATAVQAIQSQDLLGSEASRANAMLALPAYWASSGLAGFVMGTGYANHQSWLIANFSYLGEWATFSRGHVDSIVIAIFLSTGVVGLLAYLWAVVVLFGYEVAKVSAPVLLFVLALNFVFGFLISGMYWQWVFMLAVAARLACREARRPKRRRTSMPIKPVRVAQT
jgi:hypothetical protein